MRLLTLRILALVAGAIVVFVSVVALLLQVMPGPHKQLDYLVVGSVATLAALVAVFLVLMGAWARKMNEPGGPRKDGDDGTPGETG